MRGNRSEAACTVLAALFAWFSVGCGTRTSAGAPSDTTLPIDLHEGRYLYVTGELNGVSTDVIVDTGAGITVVDASLAARAGLAGTTEIQARGVGEDTRTVSLASDVVIRLGDLALPPMTVAILDLEEVHQKLGRRMPVILGKELFHAYPVTIDYDRRRLTIHTKGFEPPSDAVGVPARLVDQGHVMIEARLEDLPPAWFLVDSGSGDALDLHAPYVSANELLERYPRNAEVQMSGVGGSVSGRIAVVRSFRLGGSTFVDMPVTMATNPKGAFGSTTTAGTIGAKLLSRFTVTVDLPHERLCLVPGLRRDAPFEKNRLGLSAELRDGKTIVDFVSPGSPAEACGLEAGDEIVAVDGVELDGAGLRKRLREATYSPAGTVVRITLRDGSERTATTADYF